MTFEDYSSNELKLSKDRNEAYIRYINKKWNSRLDYFTRDKELTAEMLNIATRKAVDEMLQRDIYEPDTDGVFTVDDEELYIDTDDDIAIFL